MSVACHRAYRGDIGRPHREQFAGGIYHVFSRGNRRETIHVDSIDYRFCLATLELVFERHDWNCHAYCLMPNHLHLVVETRHADLSAGIHRFKTRYARWFNDRHGLVGHVYQGRFGSRVIVDTPDFLTVARYLALNPVLAGFCREPEEWPWSSYAAVAAEEPATIRVTPMLLEQFGRDPALARRRLREFVRDGLRQP